MDDGELIGRIEAEVEPVVASHGLVLVDIDWKVGRGRGSLRVYVDKVSGVGVGDCERVSREIGDVLDGAGLIGVPYDLEVSSPGVDRWLETEREYRWAVGRRVRCWIGPGQELRGRLAAFDGGLLVIEGNGERTEVQRGDVAKARLEPDLPWSRRV